LEVTKWDIFHYTYALLHDPVYRSRYAENLKRELPGYRLTRRTCRCVSPLRSNRAELLRLHLNYEQAEEYPLQWLENRDVPFSWGVEKMRLNKEKTR